MKQSNDLERVLAEQASLAKFEEDALMGAILLDASCLDSIKILGSMFLQAEVGEAFDLLCHMRVSGTPIDLTTVYATFKSTRSVIVAQSSVFEAIGGSAQLAKWGNSSLAHNALIYAAGVERWYRVRILRKQLCDRIAELNSIDADATKVALSIDAIIQPTLFTDTSNEALTFGTIANLAVEAALNAESNHYAVPYGYADLDARTGGLYRTEFTVIAARPSAGKSALGFGIAVNAAKLRKHVLFVSCEMSHAELGQRLLSLETSIPVNRIRKGYLSSEEHEQLAEAAKTVAPLLGSAWIAASPTVSQIKAKAKLAKAMHGIDLIIVDYLGLIRSTVKGPLYEQVTDTSKSLKALAIEMQVPVVALAQLSRDAGKTDAPPRLEHLRDSGSIEQDANNVIFIHPQRGKPESTVVIAKQRQGEVGAFDMRFNSDRCCFEDIDCSNDFAVDFR